MIAINPQTYQTLATLLLETVADKEFFNGSIDLDTEEFYSTLTCTLLIYPHPEPGLQDQIVPVWWEFHLRQPEGEVLTDFSWNELAKYLN